MDDPLENDGKEDETRGCSFCGMYKSSWIYFFNLDVFIAFYLIVKTFEQAVLGILLLIVLKLIKMLVKLVVKMPWYRVEAMAVNGRYLLTSSLIFYYKGIALGYLNTHTSLHNHINLINSTYVSHHVRIVIIYSHICQNRMRPII